MVKIKTIKIDPHPLSITARGGNKIESNTLQKLIDVNLQLIFKLLVGIKTLLLQSPFLYLRKMFLSKINLLSYLLLLVSATSLGQYEFTGKVNVEHLDGTLYLSVVEDYRKISGVYPEQILSTTSPDSLGSFSFTGNNLPLKNRMYRIHIDTCQESEQGINHFTGHCPNSKEIVFIANNTTSVSLPFSFDKEIFCEVVSENEKAKSILKIDSLKNDMRFAFGTYRSEANRKLNSKKWFSILQQYGEQLQEPLAELYSFAFLSDRSNELYGFYLEDLRANSYYDDLLERLKQSYPNSPYTQQYEAELTSDKYLINEHTKTPLPWWVWVASIIGLLSLAANFYFFGKMKKLQKKEQSKAHLTQQEQKVLELILEEKSNKEIASQLFVSVSTVKTHINNVYKKLEVSSRQEVKERYAS